MEMYEMIGVLKRYWFFIVQGVVMPTAWCLILQVVEKLIRGLAMEDSRNMFALFEHNQQVDRAVESRVIVADILAKFER